MMVSRKVAGQPEAIRDPSPALESAGVAPSSVDNFFPEDTH
jgi:hypothetical protein